MKNSHIHWAILLVLYSGKIPILIFDLLFLMILCMFLAAVPFQESKAFYPI